MYIEDKEHELVEHGLGAIPSPYDVRDYMLATIQPQDLDNLPDSFDLGILAIKDQGKRSTCMAHVAAEIIEYHNVAEGNPYTKFSTEYIYGNRESNYAAEGMYLRDALKIMRQQGDVEYDLMPGNHNAARARRNVQPKNAELAAAAYPNRITSYYKINDEDELKYALYYHGPVAAGMRWYRHCSLDKNYMYTFDPKDNFSGHAVMIVGWGKDYWIVQNSWGKGWGTEGRFYIPMTIALNELFFDLYGVVDEYNELKDVQIPSQTIIRFGKLLNIFMRLFKKVHEAFVSVDPLNARPHDY